MAKKCEKHPKYQGLRKPRAKDENGELCPACVAIFEETRATGLKETRVSKKRKPKVVAEAVTEVESTPVPEPVEVKEEVVEAPVEEEECDACSDDELLNKLVEDNEWDFEDDDDDDEIELE